MKLYLFILTIIPLFTFAQVDGNGGVHIQDSLIVGDETNSITIDTSNGYQMFGSTTTYDDLRIDASALPTNPDEPALTAGFAGSALLAVRMFQGSVRDDKQYFNVQLSHFWKEEGFFELHIHTSPWTTPVATDAAVWQFNYTWQNVNGTFTAPTTVTIKQPLGGIDQWKHTKLELEDFSTAGKEMSSVLVCSIFRLANSNASDTYTGGMSILYIDGHYEINSIGSSNELIK